MTGLRSTAIRWYRKLRGAPAGSDIREEGLDTVLDGNTAAALSEAALSCHISQSAEGPRGLVAAATGLALAGRRTTAFLTGSDVAATQDLLASAAGKHAPLVLHLRAQALTGHGSSLGSGHESVHLSADSGFFMLFAMNVQEAVDFTYIARRTTEESLVPGMVVMDGEQTALAPQDTRLLSPAQVNSFVGSARDLIDAPTAAQKLLFGETRRRVPAWHDLDEPALTGALFDRDSFALGAVARGPFFDAYVKESLQNSFADFEGKTGRAYEAISRYRLDNAETVLLAQGSAVETARVAADRLRKEHSIKAGVVGIRVLRPFPAAEIGEAIAGCRRLLVLERMDAPLSGELPLSREIRAAMASAQSKKQPALKTAVYGVGGLPLRVADLVEFARAPDSISEKPVYLGISFDDESASQPKREVMLDALRRAYPDIARLGIRADDKTANTVQSRALTIAIKRASGSNADGMLATAGAILQQLEGGRIRSRPSIAWDRWSDTRSDWLIHGDDALQDPGDDLVADVTLLAKNGEVLVGRTSKTFTIPVEAGSADASEVLLGGLFAAMQAEGILDHKPRRIIAARKALLDGVSPDRRDRIVAAFEAGLEQAAESDSESAAGPQAVPWDGEAPAAVRHLGRDDDHFASLPRFWDQTGVLYRDGTADRLTADPFLATGTMPPLSSTFHDTSSGRSKLPAFDPANCTGCGKCWTNCPESAIGVVASRPAALIDAGISRCGVDAVRQVSGKLASRIISSNRKAEQVPPTFGEMLDDAYAWLGDKMPLPDDRKQAIDAGISRISAEMGALPVAVTKPFFHDAEALKKDSAELLSVVINPEACKSCGLCVANCEPEALRGVEQDTDVQQKASELWSLFSETPDTAAETLERVSEDPEVGPMAAILLSRYCQFAMPGGDPAEAGSGEKIAVRLALSATEFHQQPIAQRFANSLAEAGESVATLVNETLSATLAIEDLDAVTDKLKSTSSPRVDLQDLADSIGAADDRSIDTDYLLRLIGLLDRIKSSHHQLIAGEHGLGRARYGLAVAGGTAATWAGAFPHNPFQAPVLIDMSGDAAQLSAGLIEGHLEETTELVRLLRLARIEVDQPDGADWKREEVANLQWPDLDPDELALCPPLILLGSDEMLAGRGLSQLIWLLNSGLPVKVLVLSSLDFGLTEPHSNDPRGNLGLLALAQRKAYVAQTSIATPDHLGASVMAALRHEGPALIQVYAPSPARHGYVPRQTLAQAQLAVDCRALPVFRYDPDAEGVFGSRIAIDGNPEDREDSPTLADWALGQTRFASSFETLAADAAGALPIREWLQLDARGRKGKTPWVSTENEDGEQRYAVSPELAAASLECLANWQTLQELAGTVTPFTERLEEEIRADLTVKHEADLAEQKKAFEAEIRTIQEKTQTEIASKLRSRLMQLASRKRD